jgi:hypothetical protein
MARSRYVIIASRQSRKRTEWRTLVGREAGVGGRPLRVME